jgi:hypothetical protein
LIGVGSQTRPSRTEAQPLAILDEELASAALAEQVALTGTEIH